jgi:GT2 family glycosyltransferase
MTVVIATRNRGASVARTVASVLDNALPRYEVAVVDQSEDDRTTTAVEPFLEDPRVRYRRTATCGLSRAHNLALAAAATELVAITDDDCEVPGDWLLRLAAAFARDERIGIVFGNVLPAAHDPTAGFVPGYVRRAPFLARSLRDKPHVDGMGACMGLRRSLWARLGGFDERFGAGAAFRAANEGDLVIRALGAGWFVYETPACWVVHHGFRNRSEARALVRGYSFGTGAMMAKHVRAGTPGTWRLLGLMAWRWARGRAHSAVRFGGGRHRLLRLDAFVRGFAAGTLGRSP